MDKNPPAFPHTNGELHPDFWGMTLRDYFAGQALVGALLSQEDHFTGNSTDMAAIKRWRAGVHASWAEFAYQMADAMLAARETHDV